MSIDKILKKLPPQCATLAFSLYGVYLNGTRYNKEYDRVYKELLSHEKWSQDQIREYQFRHAREIIKEAITHVPYYRKWALEVGFSLHDFNSLDDITLFPILEQKTVKDSPELFINETIKQMKVRWTKTGGTTGRGLSLPISLGADHITKGIGWRARSRFGIERNQWFAQIFGRDFINQSVKNGPFYAVNYPGKQLFLSAHHISIDTISHYCEVLNKYKPIYLTGYPSILTVMAAYMEHLGLKLKYKPNAIWTSSEVLLGHQEDIITRVFSAPCLQLYGQTEQVAEIITNKNHQLQVEEEFGYSEFIPVEENLYSLISTGLHNFAFPLIRYNTNDFVTIKSGTNSWPRLVEKIDGRYSDFLVDRNGKKIFAINQVFKNVVNISGIQFHEVKQGSYNVLYENIYGDCEKDLTSIRMSLDNIGGKGILLNFIKVDKIMKTKNGKTPLIIHSESNII
ncbi:hypothetical protein [Chitinivibrio alkaliphilus]|uniref:Coenzyme F390 synthetase n=1 Tax=Chitinivibrio alkaliphilus ACht1 TaxID=1313304 RepID=U7DAI7_9BACT|nr:hypothetical protein [Chitinivibrio alkaliphilus]ERP31405.1 hypothetical protein CALK_1755 [Chitinivibrio alkaliphilus ACht1]